MTHRNKDIIQSFLINPHFRIYRHLLLIIVSALIAAAFVWDLIPFFSYFELFLGLGIFTSILLCAIYFNIYILTPRFLLKNKLFAYFISIILIVFVLIILIFIVQENLFKAEQPLEGMNNALIVVVICSSIIAMTFLLAGTSTILLFKQWMTYSQRISELESTTLQTELKHLKNQINPHFLFNMLNNANIMAEDDPNMASHILAKLNEMLDYQINDSTKERVYLSEDILFINSFLDLEKTRRDHFNYIISQDNNIDSIQIPPLLFITFVENAVKHNPDNNNLSYIHISFKVIKDKLIFICENSKPKVPIDTKVGGLGLANIKRRLDLLYSSNYKLDIIETLTTYTINLELKI